MLVYSVYCSKTKQRKERRRRRREAKQTVRQDRQKGHKDRKIDRQKGHKDFTAIVIVAVDYFAAYLSNWTTCEEKKSKSTFVSIQSSRGGN